MHLLQSLPLLSSTSNCSSLDPAVPSSGLQVYLLSPVSPCSTHRTLVNLRSKQQLPCWCLPWFSAAIRIKPSHYPAWPVCWWLSNCLLANYLSLALLMHPLLFTCFSSLRSQFTCHLLKEAFWDSFPKFHSHYYPRAAWFFLHSIFQVYYNFNDLFLWLVNKIKWAQMICRFCQFLHFLSCFTAICIQHQAEHLVHTKPFINVCLMNKWIKELMGAGERSVL